MAKNQPRCILEIQELALLHRASAAQTAEFRDRYNLGLFFKRHLKEVGIGGHCFRSIFDAFKINVLIAGWFSISRGLREDGRVAGGAGF